MAGPTIATGAGGLIGHALVGSGAVGLARRDLDICDRVAIARALDTLRPSAVVNAAAQAGVDLADREPERTWQTNGSAVGDLARSCQARGIRFVHLSTDYVLDNSAADLLDEAEAPNPQSTYARSKLAGEEHALAAGAVVVRVQWVYRPGHPGFFTRCLDGLARGDTLDLVTDQIGTPTPAIPLAAALLVAAAGGPTGLFHLACTGETSAWGWIEAAAATAGLPFRARPITRAALIGAHRPARSCLDSSHFARTFGVRLPPWQDALSDALSSWTPR
jgi:dTDP-4-dehydrorhamnose reductase